MLPTNSTTRDTLTSVIQTGLLDWTTDDSPGARDRDRATPARGIGRRDALMSGDSIDSGRLAAEITKAASKQTYYTIRCLVDRERVADAYRAYAYFRWVDDNLDLEISDRKDRIAFLERQQTLVERCVRGRQPNAPSSQERMLVHLLRDASATESGLLTYVQDMMAVMSFDTGRRGRLITGPELEEYERLLATAVTEALHHFIGHGRYAPRDETRYMAATGAHITHMLRDSCDDLAGGYFNVPGELLDAYGMGPSDTGRRAYRDWVRTRVTLARECFDAGRDYLRRVENWRCRLAGCCYIARFEGVLDAIEADDYVLRPDYAEVGTRCAAAQAGWDALCSAARRRRGSETFQTVESDRS